MLLTTVLGSRLNDIQANYDVDVSELLANITVEKNNRYTRTLGLCHVRYDIGRKREIHCIVKLSGALFHPVAADLLNEVLRHETAHAILWRKLLRNVPDDAIRLYQESGHGRQWQLEAIRCGAKPQATQTLTVDVIRASTRLGTVQRRTRVPREVVCADCGQSFGHTLKNIKSNWIHRGCGGKIIKLPGQ